MSYTKVFNNPYPNGWENYPSEDTPITAASLQEHTDAIEHIEDYLEDNLQSDFPLNTTNVIITNPQDGQFLIYDGDDNKFKNITVPNAEEESF